MILLLAKRLALGLALGGGLGFVYQKAIGCRTGTCPLTATPLRAILYGGVLGLVWAPGPPVGIVVLGRLGDTLLQAGPAS
jgi:hypothetical protein